MTGLLRKYIYEQHWWLYSSAFARVSFHLYNVLYNSSTRKDVLTFKSAEHIRKIQFIDSIR